MGMTTYVKGFAKPTERYIVMLNVYKACKAAKVSIPEEVEAFFHFSVPEDSGMMEVEIKDAASHWTDKDMEEGIEVDLSKLPENVTSIRFVNSW